VSFAHQNCYPHVSVLVGNAVSSVYCDVMAVAIAVVVFVWSLSWCSYALFADDAVYLYAEVVTLGIVHIFTERTGAGGIFSE